MNRRDWLKTAGGGATALAVQLPALAQAQDAYPSKPVTLIVPQPAGGDADAVCRLLSPTITRELGQPLIIDNRGGAAGNIGTALGAKAAPDGYTITFVNQGILAFNPTLYPSVGYLPDSLVPITWLTNTDLIICCNPARPIDSLKSLISQARANPGRITYGTAGNGSANHIAAKLLESLAKIELSHVPYKGGAQAIVDTIGGQIDTVVAFPLAALPHIRAGKLRALAVTGAKRAKALPDVPTVAESGVSGYEFSSWFGLMAPRGTPKIAIDRVFDATSKALRVPENVETLRNGLTEPVGGSPQQFADLITREVNRWPPLIKAYGVKID